MSWELEGLPPVLFVLEPSSPDLVSLATIVPVVAVGTMFWLIRSVRGRGAGPRFGAWSLLGGIAAAAAAATLLVWLHAHATSPAMGWGHGTGWVVEDRSFLYRLTLGLLFGGVFPGFLLLADRVRWGWWTWVLLVVLPLPMAAGGMSLPLDADGYTIVAVLLGVAWLALLPVAFRQALLCCPSSQADNQKP